MKNIFFSIFIFAYTLIALAQTPNSNQNYMMSEIPTVAIQQLGDVANLNVTQKSASITYFDGLGREIQKIDWAASNDQKDIVKATEYDNIGRISRDFLPYKSSANTAEIQSNTLANAQSFYYQMYGVATPSYADRLFDGSPLNEVREQGFAGAAWQIYDTQGNILPNRHTQQAETKVFDASIPIPVWNRYAAISFSFVRLYVAGELLVNESIDENGHKNIVYKDKLGRTILSSSQVDNTNYANTMYFYNDLGQLELVIQPEGYASLVANGWYLNGNIKEEYGFQYIYDNKGRVKAKKVPASGWQYFIYDKLDRLVLSQDRNLGLQHDWLFTKYDILGRPIMTGIFTNPQYLTLNDLENIFDAGTYPLYETRTALPEGYSDQAFPPLNQIDIHSITYYDNYDLDSDGTPDYTYTINPNFPNNTPYENAIGKVTAVKTRILNPDPDMPDWLITVSFYDKYGRVLQTRADNHLGGYDITTSQYDFVGKVLKTESLHEANEVLVSGGALQMIKNTVRKQYSYDHRGRLLEVKQGINSEIPIILLQNKYDALGKLIEKNLHSKDNGAHFLQSVDYRYNIRGWLTHINTINYSASRFSFDVPLDDSPEIWEDINLKKVHVTAAPEDSLGGYGLVGDTLFIDLKDVPEDSVANKVAQQIADSFEGQSVAASTKEALKDLIMEAREGGGGNEPIAEDNDLFREELRYDDPYTNLASGGTPLYNGNIATQIWQTNAQGNRVRSYHYQYDAMNRLTGDLYWSYINATWCQVARYNTQNIQYDLNGNLLTMQRRGIVSNVNNTVMTGNIDDLSYTYTGNRLEAVEDAAPLGVGIYPFPTDFQNNASLPTEYLYDLNGNIVEDKNAGFDVKYNHLNKPIQIHQMGSGNVIHITYAADGTKLRQKTGIETLDYSTVYLYRNGEMLYFAHEEGRCLRTATQQTGGVKPVLEPVFRYEYNLKDHLGNVRISFTDDGTGLALVLQEQHYEAYGMELGGLSYYNGETNRYTYSGKEKIAEYNLGWSDFGARMYNPTIGRWNGGDIMASERVSWTPYNAMSCSPISRNDPTGELDDWVQHDGKIQYDSRVTDDKTAKQYYGSQAIYRGVGYQYTSGDRNVTLGENGAFTQNGANYIAPNHSQESASFIGGFDLSPPLFVQSPILPDATILTLGLNGTLGPAGGGISISFLATYHGNDPGFEIYLNTENSQGLDGSVSATVGAVYFDNPNNWRSDFKGQYGGLEVGASGLTGGISGGYTGPEIQSIPDFINLLDYKNYGEKVHVIYVGGSAGVDLFMSGRVIEGNSIPLLKK